MQRIRFFHEDPRAHPPESDKSTTAKKFVRKAGRQETFSVSHEMERKEELRGREVEARGRERER